MSMSKPTALPAGVVDSMGGNVGSLQYLNEPFTGEVTRWLAPAVPTTARAAIKASRESGPTERFIAPPLLASILGRARRMEVPTLARIPRLFSWHSVYLSSLEGVLVVVASRVY